MHLRPRTTTPRTAFCSVAVLVLLLATAQMAEAAGFIADPAIPVTYPNDASGSYSFIGGGEGNTATGNFDTISGGKQNTASNLMSTVAGGDGNQATGYAAAVGGGNSNHATAQQATIGGGTGNRASKTYATIGGGYGNEAGGSSATVGGGRGNVAVAYGFVGGGKSNVLEGYAATIVGGWNNKAGGTYGFVGGGKENVAGGHAGFVGGGRGNSASGNYGFVGGGRHNKATQEDSAALGEYALAEHTDSLVLGFNGTDCKSNGPRTVSICASKLFLNGNEISAGDSSEGGSTGSAFNATEMNGMKSQLQALQALLGFKDFVAGNATIFSELETLKAQIANLKVRREEANTLNAEESASSDLTATTSFPLMLCLPAGMFMSLLFLDK